MFIPIDIVVGRDYPKKVIPLIKAAERSISILVFDWRWYDDQPGSQIQLFNNAIVNSVKRGVCVRATIFKGDTWRVFKNLGINAKKLDSSHVLHVKLIIIDSKIVVLGSHNFTKSAFDLNYEASVIIYSEEIAKQFYIEFGNFFV